MFTVVNFQHQVPVTLCHHQNCYASHAVPHRCISTSPALPALLRRSQATHSWLSHCLHLQEQELALASSDLSQGKGRISIMSGSCGLLSSRGSLQVLKNAYLKT